MTRNKKIIIAIITAVIVIFAGAPWLNNQSLHDKVFEERAKIDGTIDKYTGEQICDYKVMWAPFGRWVASCEGGYYVTFWGGYFPKAEPVSLENPCIVCINGCDTCPEGCEECLIGIEKKLKDPNLKWYYSPEGSQKFNEITVPVFVNDEPATVINSLLQTLNDSSFDIKFSDSVKSSQWWISDDGWNINDPNAISITSKTSTRDSGQMWPAIGSLAKELNYFLSRIFLANDFILNATNTSKSEEDNDFYDYIIAFQKGGTRCILKTDGDYGQYSVICSNRFQEAYDEQIPYLKALDDRNVVVGIKERIGDFVWLSAHLRRTGFLALMRDDASGIELIFTGQEAPPCSLMIENQVPKEVYGACYDEAGNIVE